MSARQRLAVALSLAMLGSWSGSLVAQVGEAVVGAFPQVQQVPPAEALASVQWAGPSIALDQLGDKSALLLVYATWCPRCNVWSGEFFT